jgi:hypothetical protein
MAHERDERWVYVALGVLIAAYIIYRTGASIRIPIRELRGLGKFASYGLAPLFAVLYQLWSRRRAAALKAKHEAGVLLEGLLRDEMDVRARFANGRGGGVFGADVRLTRAALYVFDRSGRRDPMRFSVRGDVAREYTVIDAELLPGASPDVDVVRVDIGGPRRFAVEFTSTQAEAWWIELRRAIGRSTDRRAAAMVEARGVDDEEASTVEYRA